jgi:hypothetical protein
MKKNNVICPACGSKDLERKEVDGKDCVTLGSEFTYKEIYYHCRNCFDEFDIFNESEKNFRDAEQQAHKLFAAQAIGYLADKSISMALFERVFELPTRTLTRWKEGNLSASALSLLRILITYPWIVKVAEKKYISEFATYELIHAAANTFIKYAAVLPYGFKLEKEQISNDTTCYRVSMDITKETLPRAGYKEIMGVKG